MKRRTDGGTMDAEEIIAMRCAAHGLSAKRPGWEIVRGLCGRSERQPR